MDAFVSERIRQWTSLGVEHQQQQLRQQQQQRRPATAVTTLRTQLRNIHSDTAVATATITEVVTTPVQQKHRKHHQQKQCAFM